MDNSIEVTSNSTYKLQERFILMNSLLYIQKPMRVNELLEVGWDNRVIVTYEGK